MISKNAVLQKLAPFTNFKKVLIDDQNTSDIIQGILDNHDNYQDEYDKISEMFIGDNEVETARNVFNFLKNNVPYYIEPIEKQTLRSPSAIVCMKQGADCKSYASFINGIMNSLNRKGIFRVPLAYRFASYRYDTKEPQHVFAVLYPGTKNEVWVDPVLAKFDQRKEPVFIKDKKIKMALIAMSGTATQPTASLQEMERYRDKLVNLRDKYLDAMSGKKIAEQDYLSNSISLILNSSITGSKVSETLRLNLETYQRSHRNEVLKAIKKSEVYLLGPLGLCFLPTFMLIAVVPLIGSLITGFMS